MRFLWKLLLIGSCMLAFASANARPSIQVRPGDWGTAQAGDIEAVLALVADVLVADFPRHASATIVVSYSSMGPRVLAEKTGDGAYQVLLNVRDTRWDQFAYQFSHELCHIVSNYDRRAISDVPGSRSHQWFEETLCEAVSLVALDRLTSRWQEAPPFAGWQRYAPAFRRYAQRLRNEQHRQLSDADSLARWYRDNAKSLAANPYLREQNEFAAGALTQLLETTHGIAAIGYLNLESPANDGFTAYLASWYACCPQAQRQFVRRLMELFGTA